MVKLREFIATPVKSRVDGGKWVVSVRHGGEVVRCRECMYSIAEYGSLWCRLLRDGAGWNVGSDDFCCWGDVVSKGKEVVHD